MNANGLEKLLVFLCEHSAFLVQNLHHADEDSGLIDDGHGEDGSCPKSRGCIAQWIEPAVVVGIRDVDGLPDLSGFSCDAETKEHADLLRTDSLGHSTNELVGFPAIHQKQRSSLCLHRSGYLAYDSLEQWVQSNFKTERSRDPQ